MGTIISQLKSKPHLVRLAAVLIVGVLLGYWLRNDGGDAALPPTCMRKRPSWMKGSVHPPIRISMSAR